MIEKFKPIQKHEVSKKFKEYIHSYEILMAAESYIEIDKLNEHYIKAQLIVHQFEDLTERDGPFPGYDRFKEIHQELVQCICNSITLNPGSSIKTIEVDDGPELVN